LVGCEAFSAVGALFNSQTPRRRADREVVVLPITNTSGTFMDREVKKCIGWSPQPSFLSVSHVLALSSQFPKMAVPVSIHESKLAEVATTGIVQIAVSGDRAGVFVTELSSKSSRVSTRATSQRSHTAPFHRRSQSRTANDNRISAQHKVVTRRIMPD
jgi:hypothetical protein